MLLKVRSRRFEKLDTWVYMVLVTFSKVRRSTVAANPISLRMWVSWARLGLCRKVMLPLRCMMALAWLTCPMRSSWEVTVDILSVSMWMTVRS